MKQIYNEGRIAGLSQYELYVRQLLSLNPEATPLTEREWLASTLSANISMILKIKAGTHSGIHNYTLPSNSQICVGTVLYASVFQGEVTTDLGGCWATSVTDYGELIENNDTVHPQTPGQPEDVPTKEDPNILTDKMYQRCRDYLKITSSIYIQPGVWTYNEGDIRASLDPNLGEPGYIRLIISENIKEDLYILFTGFVNSTMLQGQLSSNAPDISHPQDGDFLGPTKFPWSCPIKLLVTTDVQKSIDIDTNRQFKILENHVNFLGTLHTIVYTTPLLTEEGEVLLTEDGETLLTDKEGSVTEMWEEQGQEKVTHFVPLLTEGEEELESDNPNQGVIWVPKHGTMNDMIVDGGIL